MNILGDRPDTVDGSSTLKVKEEPVLEEAFPGTNCDGNLNLSGVVIKTEVSSDNTEEVLLSCRSETDSGLQNTRDESTNIVSPGVNIDQRIRTSDFLNASDRGACFDFQQLDKTIKTEGEMNDQNKGISGSSNLSKKPVIKIENGMVSKENITWDIVPIKKIEQKSDLTVNENVTSPFVSKRSLSKKEIVSTRSACDDDFNFEMVLVKEENESSSEEISLTDNFDAEESNPLATFEETILTFLPENSVFGEEANIYIENEESLEERILEIGNGIQKQFEIAPNFVGLLCVTDQSNKNTTKKKKPDKRKPQQCPLCSALFTRRHNLVYHMRTHTGEKPFPCEKCPARFRNKNGLKVHFLRVHTDVRPYPCSLCSRTFCRSDLLNAHMKTHTGEKPFLCEFCPAKFARNDKLKDHMLKHAPDQAKQTYTCSLCPIKFFRKDKLKAHLKVHTDDRPFACNQCPLTFRRADALKAHMRLHSGVMPFACVQCSAKFRRKHFLKMHERVHAKDARLTCEHCSGKFRRKKEIMSHFEDSECSLEFRQTGMIKCRDKLHSCSYCPAKFMRKIHLNVHAAMHTKKEMFCCAHCPAKFPSKYTLAVHLKVHSDNNPHSCPHCTAKFKRIRDVTRHLKVHL